MNCTTCGNPLRPDAAFCDRCGEPTREGKPSRTRILVVMVLALALFVVLALIGIRGLLGSGNGSDASGGTGGATTTAGGTATGAQTPSGSQTPATPGKTPTSAVSLPPGATACPEPAGGTATLGTWTGSKRTSCAFALAVRDAYAAASPSGGKATVRAKSSVTGKTYTMTCTGSQPVTCKGGDDAVVYLAT